MPEVRNAEGDDLDPVMAAVTASWHAILDADPFEPDRRLIDTGADSLRIMRFVLRLEQLLDRKVAYDLLSPETTPRTLAASLGEGASQPAALPRMFYLSGLNGTDYQMMSHLRASLGEEIVFTHADAPGLDQPPALLRDMDATAVWIAANISAAQPGGPIRLAGYSVGGIQAFEVARQLIGLGREVALLCLFDPLLRRSIPRVIRDTLRKPMLLPGKLRNRGPRIQPAERKSAGQNVLVRMALRIGAYGLASKAVRLTGSRNAEAGADEADIFRLWHRRLVAVKHWRPQPLAVDTILVLTDDGARFKTPLFWRKWIDKLTIVAVPGTHDALSRTPVTEDLRAAILDHVNAGGSPS